MAAKYSDDEINVLIQEKKPLPRDFRSSIRLRDKRGHKEQELDVQGVNGNKFRLILRQSNFDELVKSQKCPRIVIPVKTGIQRFQRVTKTLDTGFHRCDDFLREHQF